MQWTPWSPSSWPFGWRDMERLKLALEIAREQLGRPYAWGGDDPLAGFDCSGFVLEVLRSVGLYPPTGDTTADGLMKYGFMEVEPSEAQPGTLVFWGTNKATHVEMIYARFIDGMQFTIGASGGGSQTLTMADAIKQNAYIKIRPLRLGVIAARDPFARWRPGNSY